MKYYRNYELANLYHVSQATITNWIASARSGKLGLTLIKQGDRDHIANTASNIALIEELAAKGKKYRNRNAYKIVRPSKEFYGLYDAAQVFDIIESLDVHREIPLQYTYFNGGATYWDKYARRLLDEEEANTLTTTIDLLQSNFANLDRLLDSSQRVNIIDLGVGNGLPVKDLLAYLLSQGKLARYIGIDISPAMLGIAKDNIGRWFDDQVAFEGHVRDITHERFSDLIADDSFSEAAGRSINLVLLLGGTLANFRSPNRALETINSSMGRDDLLIYTKRLDVPSARRYFDFNTDESNNALPPRHMIVLGLLNIESNYYEVEQVYDDVQRARITRIRLKIALSIIFKGKNGERAINLEKGETILLWRSWHQNTFDVLNQLDANGFTLRHSSITDDQQYLLAITQVKTDPPV